MTLIHVCLRLYTCSAVSVHDDCTCAHTKRKPPIVIETGLKGGTNRPQVVLHPPPSMQSLPLIPSSDKRYDPVASNQTGYPGNICNYQTGIEMIYGDLSPYSLITS